MRVRTRALAVLAGQREKGEARIFDPLVHTTLLRYSPGPRRCSCLHAASQLLQPVQRSRSISSASRPLFCICDALIISPCSEIPPGDFAAAGDIAGEESHGDHVNEHARDEDPGERHVQGPPPRLSNADRSARAEQSSSSRASFW